MAKNKVNEAISLDKIMKYALVGFFGPKVMDSAFRKKVLRDPEIKKKLSDLQGDLTAVEDRLAKIKQIKKSALGEQIIQNLQLLEENLKNK
tara:strand:+ start:2475 stop:2747 length:273 start_codon:yes stop_codon:yes gene_type:complete